ncbi:hypothetical protein COW99_00735 [Candidatus Roizmanbacteria bacterium CG22_combo_CG10-13_8_21_14_all_38_20]|uniref:Uncharacterized protein n=1 Tax=Candidatus Roizmanbacteria bacterium CG22_combo_CG10-13_8_21_14_all_38_20 TaxID=1974862 RepID=A0A2H0BWJ2_9BACT|nr:hypothetical protein [Candidatus Microgenomates bacterium]PIP62056.1 MAG: hypothetical protein COW99_00735 [Candidatus Roizmanbacteria bacterium CG22_combo_CG10-13_8_21_14_all_38_20]PJC31296.1 MAG: hypothetical protein CO050_03460 [Candidatus Roizmanbacteria bacterium CG_4_9_14_0_2_um_filter_38_17]
MEKNKIAISSLALDLRRVAQAYYRSSDRVAERFMSEAIRRKAEVDTSLTPNYIRELLYKVQQRSTDPKKDAEKYLMYSVLFQNYAVT